MLTRFVKISASLCFPPPLPSRFFLSRSAKKLSPLVGFPFMEIYCELCFSYFLSEHIFSPLIIFMTCVGLATKGNFEITNINMRNAESKLISPLIQRKTCLVPI